MIEDIAQFRRAVRAHLADRPAVAQSPATIHRAVGPEHGASVGQVAEACIFLTSLGDFRELTDPLGGSTRRYQITATGTIAHESEN